mmetsp:Transcript_122026/g.356496  ORF Transcript_122026/g.356496 Transcript_122026/m.356496 type:complete len:214 (+) Transcript_122026:1347-1988(+)
MICQKPSCHLKTVFFVTTYGTTSFSRQRVKKMCARSSTLSRGLSYTTTAHLLSFTSRPSMTTGLSSMFSGKKVVSTRPLPTFFQPAPYSPPTACLSKRTGRLNPSSIPGMWMVSREMVMPFHPLRMAPFGEPRGLLSPSSTICSLVGVTVGSLKMAPICFPAATASWRTWSLVSSLAVQLRSKYSQREVSTKGCTQRSRMICMVYRDISSPEM